MEKRKDYIGFKAWGWGELEIPKIWTSGDLFSEPSANTNSAVEVTVESEDINADKCTWQSSGLMEDSRGIKRNCWQGGDLLQSTEKKGQATCFSVFEELI